MTELEIPGMFWRFQPNDDKEVERFIVRDSDSRITEREKIAVEEWEKEDKVLHIMRDHPHHNFHILAGMFGIGGGLIIVPVLIGTFINLGFDTEIIVQLSIGTAISCIIFTGLSSANAHRKKNSIDFNHMIVCEL